MLKRVTDTIAFSRGCGDGPYSEGPPHQLQVPSVRAQRTTIMKSVLLMLCHEFEHIKVSLDWEMGRKRAALSYAQFFLNAEVTH